MSQIQETQPIKLPVHPLINPLTEHDLLAIEEVLRQGHMIADLLHRAAACDVDVGEHFTRHTMHQVVAKKLKDHFFPDQLPTTQE